MARPPLLRKEPAVRSRLRALLPVALAAACAALAIGPTPANARGEAGFVLIAHPDNPLGEVSRSFVSDAFLKKATRWGNGETVRPVDLPPSSLTRRRFSESVLKRSVSAVRSYWQQRIFTGRDVPPPELESEAAVVGYVLKYSGAVGYVAPGSKTGAAKVLQLGP